MISIKTLAILLFSAMAVDAAGVVGKAEGFAAGATGGGSAAAASPANLNELINWLSDGVARTIVLDKTWDFTGSMGSKTEKGCKPRSNTCPNGTGQDSIDINGWCEQDANADQSIAKPVITYDVAGIPPSAIKLGSNKSIIGVGSAGKIKGRGFYIAGAKNIIIQNVEFVEMNPKYIWGGDAISVDGTDLLWIDHVKISRIGRQFITMGPGASNRVTISNSEFDGTTSWSAMCNNHHYWTLYFTGSQDSVTFKGNYIHNTSGRGPKVGGLHSAVKPNVFLQVANNYWSGIAGNAFQIGEGAKVLAEANVFENTVTPVIFDIPSNPLWSSSTGVTACAASLGRNCQANTLAGSGAFAGSNTDVLAAAKGLPLAPVSDVAGTKDNVLKSAGIGKI
ncbi:f3ea311f-f9bb-4baf-a530-39c638dff0e1-CDS [Sclerotinia trifoliorum]|uniref:pectin lyase n=1 Tax=Sclerotinia trifoliorum TaxID=28548 RepID=A0A8H2VY73_9HELO|nr:f3ea311f-f9bb-4baf-a530-39c638dff0e1-CDS [Sclerotinia trifoliorum]